MQLILNPPMPTNEEMKLLGTRNDTTNVILSLIKRFATSIPASLHHDAALDPRPLMPKGSHSIKYAHLPSRAPSMLLFVFLILVEWLIRLGLLPNALIQSLLIGFDTHQIVIALLDNLMQCFFDSAGRRVSRQSH